MLTRVETYWATYRYGRDGVWRHIAGSTSAEKRAARRRFKEQLDLNPKYKDSYALMRVRVTTELSLEES